MEWILVWFVHDIAEYAISRQIKNNLIPVKDVALVTQIQMRPTYETVLFHTLGEKRGFVFSKW